VQQAATYLENQVLTASPHRLHLMVVDAAIRHARRGLEGLERQEWETTFRSLSAARDCMSELIGGLNPAIDADLVDPTKDLFVFVYRNLAKADFDRDPQLVRDAIRILDIHREAWIELGLQLGAGQPTGAPARPAYEDAPTTGRSWTT
jgi:flagellar secretion chaperone FliS